MHEGKLWCVVRTVNYWVKGRKYGVNDPDGITRTENYLGRFRRDGRLTRMHKMRDLDRSPRQPSKVVGYEDVRLASVDGQLFGSATVHDRGGVQVAALRIESGNVVRAMVQRTERVEKNWMPFERNGKARLDLLARFDGRSTGRHQAEMPIRYRAPARRGDYGVRQGVPCRHARGG